MIRRAFIRRQRGQGMSEYIIITALVAVAGIGLFAAFGDVLQNQMARHEPRDGGPVSVARHQRRAVLGDNSAKPRRAG